MPDAELERENHETNVFDPCCGVAACCTLAGAGIPPGVRRRRRLPGATIHSGNRPRHREVPRRPARRQWIDSNRGRRQQRAQGQARSRRPAVWRAGPGKPCAGERRKGVQARSPAQSGRSALAGDRDDDARCVDRVCRARPHHDACGHADRPALYRSMALLRCRGRLAPADRLGYLHGRRGGGSRDRHRLPSARRSGWPDPAWLRFHQHRRHRQRRQRS